MANILTADGGLAGRSIWSDRPLATVTAGHQAQAAPLAREAGDAYVEARNDRH